MNNKLIIFGPWCGEFSYETNWWIPEIRKKRKTEFNDWTAVVVGYEGRKILYEDFTDAYVPYPKEIEDTLLYSATYGQNYEGLGDIIPDNLKEFTTAVANKYQEQYGFVDVRVYWPGIMPIGQDRTMADEPFGEFKHYKAKQEILDSVSEEIKFDNDRETVAVMARIRYRRGEVDQYDWNPKHWETFIDMLVNDLKVNVVMIGIPLPPNSSSGGSLTMKDTEMYDRNKKYIKPIIFSGEDSVERQIALLQLTKCSIYGSSGAVGLAYFTKGTHIFTQTTLEQGHRLKWKWKRDLTDNLKRVKIFDKYRNREIYNSPPDELFDEFKVFYEEIV